MKFLKSMMALGMLVFCLQGIGQQGPRQQMPVADRVARTIERLKPELNLTDKQVKEIEPIYTDYFTKMDEMRSSGERPTPEARQKLTNDRDESLKKVLDDAQMKKLKELEEQMRQQRRPNG